MDPIWVDIPTHRHLTTTYLPEWFGVKDYQKDIGLREIASLVQTYGAIQKDSLKLFPMRMAGLYNVAQATKRHLKRYNGELQEWLAEWLVQRALAKQRYLHLLLRYYQERTNEVADPKSLLRELQAPRRVEHVSTTPTPTWRAAQPGAGVIGLHGGVRLEQIDPLHRAYEFHIKKGKVVDVQRTQELALQEWADLIEQDKYHEPFLVFLEKTEACISVARADAHLGITEFQSVNYYNFGSREGGMKYLRVENGLLYEVAADDTKAPFDTDFVTKEISPKGTRDFAMHGRKTLAYNWTRHGELVVAPHKEFQFHHSSFTGGGLIRCAGMIAAHAGKVYWVDNDSGHYKPPTANLAQFVRMLEHEGVLSQNACVRNAAARTGTANNADAGVPVAAFLANPDRRMVALGAHRG